MKNIYLTGCLHFSHKNICGPELSSWDRGYRNFSSLDEMNDTLFENLNSLVKENDILFNLGDFAFGDKKQIPALRQRIRCKNIYFAKGNHDKAFDKHPEFKRLFTDFQHYYEIRVGKRLICMQHFPQDVWNENGRSSLFFHSHCHGSFQHSLGKRIDVGIDCNNFFPFHIEEAIALADAKPLYLPDHHGENTNYG